MWIALGLKALLGVFLGVLGGLLGTGGGTFAIPILATVGGYEQKLAQGTALVMVVGNVVRGFAGYRGRSGMHLPHALMLAVSGSVAAALSSMWAVSAADHRLRVMYGVFLIALAGFVLWSRRVRDVAAPADARWMFVPGLIGGVSLGLFGVGGAMIAVPLLVVFFGQSQLRAQGLGLALAVPGCAISLAQYAANGHVEWLSGIALALGGLVGVPYGVRIAHAIRERTLTLAFCIFLTIAGVTLLAHR